MNLKKALPYILTILIGLIVGYLIGFAFKPKSQSQPDVVVASSLNTTDTQTVSTPVPSNAKLISSEAVLAKLPENTCIADEKTFSQKLTAFAEGIEKKQIMYNSENLSDCSGIFLRSIEFVRTQCANFQYPSLSTSKDSRAIAKWYNDQKNFIAITDPMEQRNLIKTGAVMYFGKAKKLYTSPTIEQLTAPYPKGIVEHIGIVTEVQRDANNNVTGYAMFHGRRPGVTAQRTFYHSIKPPYLGGPILGNWSQQWVGISFVMTPN